MNQAILFVYYKLLPSDHDRYQLSISLLQQEISNMDSMVELEVLQRPELGSDGQETWMEVYRHPAGVSAQMTEKIHELAMACGLPQQRKSELFIPLR